jgi:hypothetical protein
VTPGPRGAAARRRRILAVLSLATLAAAAAVTVGSVLGRPVPAWVVAVPGGLMTAYLLLLVVLRPGAAGRLRQVEHATPHDVAAHPEQPSQAPAETAPVPAQHAPAAAPEAGAEHETTWTPVPVPVPTYVTAPRARRAVRTIDLSNPGSWTSTLEPGEGEAEAAVAVSAPVAAEQPEPPLVEHRRAVGD